MKRMHRALPQLAAAYADQPALSPMLFDFDLYLAVPLRLLQVGVVPVFGENKHPNPFNASTLILFSIDAQSAGSHVDLVVYNAQGQRVHVLLSRALDVGHFSVRWDGLTESGEAVASGQYIYRLRVGEQRASGKMSLAR